MLRITTIIALFLFLCPTLTWAVPLLKQDFDLKNSPFSDIELRTLTGLKDGADVSSADIDHAKETLQKLGIWKQLSVTANDTTSGLVLQWEAEAFPLIREIHISGNNPILEKRIRRLLRLRIGDPYDPKRIQEDRNQIADLYRDEGFFKTRVKADADFNPDGHISLTFKINRGRSFLWGPITCEGNHYFSCAKIANHVRDHVHFRPHRLKEAVESLEKDYRQAGFPNIKIEVAKQEFDRRRRHVTLALAIDEGERFEIEFKGNQFLKDKKLKKASQFLARPNRGSKWQLKNAADRIEETYREKGFHDIEIIPESVKTDSTHLVTFEVDEGKRTLIKRIKFPGRKKLSKKTIHEHLWLKQSDLLTNSPFYETVLADDRARIEALYHRFGFRNATISEPSLAYSKFKDRVTIIIPITEGPLYHIGTIRFDGNTVLDEATLLKVSKLGPKKKATEEIILKAKELILREYSKQGYLYTEIKINEIERAPLLDLQFDIQEGNQVILDQVMIQGAFRTTEPAILKALNIKTAAPLDLPRLIDGKLSLRHFNAYESIDLDLIGVKEKSTRTTALLRLEERPELQNEIRAGYDSDKSFSGRYSLLKRALFQTGQQLYVDLEAGFEFSHGSVTHLFPQFRGGDWNISETAFVQYENDENFNAFSSGGYLRASRLFLPWLTLSITPGIDYIDVRSIKEDELRRRRPQVDSTLASLGTSVSLDRRNHFSDPTRGFMSTTSIEYNQDIQDAKSSFVSNSWQVAVFQKLVWRFSLWNNTHLDRIFTVSNNTDVPIQRLFFLGGNDTIRGFEEDAVDPSGGTFRFFNNTELHFAMTPSLKLAGFLDTGALTDKLRDVDLETLRVSAGPGLRYFTPVGPLKFDLGFILDRKSDEPRARFHFSFGFFF